MKKIVLVSAVAFLFVACKNGNDKDLTLTQPGSLNTQLNSSQSNAGKTTAQLPAGNSVSGLKVNPEHGQPGHRCELAVGAPLQDVATAQGAKSTSAQVTPVQTPISTTINQLAANNTLPVNNQPAAKPAATGNLNPAHGQPGHRCDISVGAPLSSAPPVKPNTPLPTASVKPVNTPATLTAPGMNPQHGQPGHRCDIAVGAPLNSAPSKVEEKKDSSAKS